MLIYYFLTKKYYNIVLTAGFAAGIIAHAFFLKIV